MCSPLRPLPDAAAPHALGNAVGLVARLGGWLGRKRDPPGAQLLWPAGLRFRTGMNSDDHKSSQLWGTGSPSLHYSRRSRFDRQRA